MQSCWVAFMVLVFALCHCCAPLRHCDSAMFGHCSCPVLRKSAILGACYKPWEQLHYLFLPCSLVGSPSWCLFLHYDIAAHPYATATVLCLDAAVAPYCGKVVFWAHAASHGNNCITCSFCAVLLGRLHGACFCGVTLMRTLTPPRQCYV